MNGFVDGGRQVKAPGLEPFGIVAAHAGRVEDGVGDGGARAADSEFADALDLQRVGLVVELRQEDHLDGRNVRIHR